VVTPAARSVSISWSGLDSHARNYVVSRSTDGTNYTIIATLSNTANNYLDSSVATGTNYFYRVAATNAVAPAATSAAVRTTTLLVAPTSLAGVLSGTKVNLTWSDSNRAGMGYIILRSSDGTNFTQLAVLAANSAKSYSDTTVLPNQT
jgi:titin